jgi:hypothetical protein
MVAVVFVKGSSTPHQMERPGKECSRSKYGRRHKKRHRRHHPAPPPATEDSAAIARGPPSWLKNGMDCFRSGGDATTATATAQPPPVEGRRSAEDTNRFHRRWFRATTRECLNSVRVSWTKRQWRSSFDRNPATLAGLQKQL